MAPRRPKAGPGSPRPPSLKHRVTSIPPGRARQNAKIREIADAIATSGFATLDEQADAIGLSRSTTWALLNSRHKGSGLSARIVTRMLSAPHLPLSVRAKILEYLAEKAAGLYGDTERELKRFVLRLSMYRTVRT